MNLTDPFSAAARHASIVREIYDAFTREGFTDEQAFALTENYQQASLMMYAVVEGNE